MVTTWLQLGTILGIQCFAAIAMLTIEPANSPSWYLIDRYGVPTAGFIAVMWFVAKKLWPLYLKQSEDSKKLLEHQLEISQTRLDKMATDSQTRFDKMAGEFLHSLEHRDALMKTEFDRLHDRWDREGVVKK